MTRPDLCGRYSAVCIQDSTLLTQTGRSQTLFIYSPLCLEPKELSCILTALEASICSIQQPQTGNNPAKARAYRRL